MTDTEMQRRKAICDVAGVDDIGELSDGFHTEADAETRLMSLEPERKTGTWVFVRGEEAGNALYMCSACGKGDIHAPEVRVPYCWHCGAQMEGSDG